MTKIFNNRWLSVVLFFMAVGLITACKKDNDLNSGKIELLSFGPTGAMHGDTLHFIGNNLDQVSEIRFTGDAAVVAKSAFLQQNNETILVLVPQAAEQGVVTLVTPQGDLVSKTRLNLEVAPSITSVTGESRPGANITISGEYLNWVTSIVFPEDVVADTFVSQSFSQIVVTVPENAQTGPLVLHYGGTEPEEVESADTLKVILPMATALSPNPVKHQTSLTITGTDLDLTTSISFPGVSSPVLAADFESQSANQIVVKVPAATTKGRITLKAASGVTTQSATELDVVLPAVTSLSPSPVDPGANLTINGTNLDLVTSVTFANAPAVTTFVSKTATRIVVKVPMGVLRGRVTLAVLNSTLTVQSDVLEITGDAPPPTIKTPFYNDAITSNWNGWKGDGWGHGGVLADYANTSPVREGSKSIKFAYVGGWGSPLQLGGGNVSTAGHTAFKLSIFGGPGSGGKKVNLGINGADGPTIVVVEGKWTDYEYPLSTLVPSGKITEIILKEFDGTGGYTLYVDAIGLN